MSTVARYTCTLLSQYELEGIPLWKPAKKVVENMTAFFVIFLSPINQLHYTHGCEDRMFGHALANP